MPHPTQFSLDTGTSSGASPTTASVTIHQNRLAILAIYIQDTGGAGGDDVTSVTSSGMTWVKIAGVTEGDRRMSLWRALKTDADHTGAITMNASGSLDWVGWALSEFSDVNLGGTNGSAAVIQYITKQELTSALSMTLGSAITTHSGTYGAFLNTSSNHGMTAGSGYTRLNNGPQNGSDDKAADEWTGTNPGSTTIDGTWDQFSVKLGIGIEIGLFGPIDYLFVASGGAVSGGAAILTTDIYVFDVAPQRLSGDHHHHPDAVPNYDHHKLMHLGVGNDHPQYVQGSALTTDGDMYVRAAGAVTRLPVGAAGSVLYSDGTNPEWTVSPKIAGYLRVGSASAPTNVTAGDMTAVRAKIGDGAFGAGIIFSVTGNGALSGYLNIGSEAVPTNTTAGDITPRRISLGNQALGASGNFIYAANNVLSTTAAGAQVFYGFAPFIICASNSSTTFRGFDVGVQLNNATTITTNVSVGFLVHHDHRQDAAIGQIQGLSISGLLYNSSSPATPGTVTTLQSLYIQTLSGSAGKAGTITTAYGIYSQMISAAGASFTVTTLTDHYIANPVSGATLANHIGIDIEQLTRGATLNIGIRNAAPYVATPSTAQNITAVTATLLANAEVIQLTANASYTLTSAPTIADGADGQLLHIVNVDSADTITLQDQGTLANSNLRLPANTVALPPRAVIKLVYSATIGDWVQIDYSNNL